MRIKFLLMSGALAVLGVLSFSLLAFAADDADANSNEEMTLSPVTQKFEIDAGDSTRGSFTVLNTGDVEFDFKVYAKPYSVSGSDYDVNYTDETAERADAYDWVTFDTTEATLSPHESMEIGFTINMPADAGLGGHYAVLFAETQPNEDTGGNQIIRRKRVGSLLRVNVSGDINERGSVVDSKIPAFLSSPPLRTTIHIKNDGNVDFIAQTTITVSDIFGNVKYRNVKSDTIVFPDTTRAIEQEWADASWLGYYNVKLEADYLTGGFTTFGRVLIVPRWLIALLVILITGGAYAAFARRRR